MSLQQQNLFSILQIGDRQIEKLKKKVCMIVGLTKNGKSCFFNHLLGKPMVGIQDSDDPQRIIYVPKPATSSVLGGYALMGSQPVSVTLAPNIADLNAEYSLIDMIGFQENRNEKSILAVSYFLSSCFQKAQTVLFTVVIASENLLCKNLELICGSFNELIEMFALSKFSAAMRKSFMNSISIVVSSAKETLSYYKIRLTVIIKQLKNQGLQTFKNRELIAEALQSVVANDKLECFAQAKLNEANPKCSIFQQFIKTGWKDFDLKQAKQSMKEELIIIPFKQDLSKLNPAAVKRLKDKLDSKVASLYEIAGLFEIYLSALRQNWLEGKYRSLELTPVRAALQRILKAQVRYKKDALCERNIPIPSNPTQNVFNILKTSIQIFELCQELDESQEQLSMGKITFDRSMTLLDQIFGKLIDCMVPAFTQPAVIQSLIQVKFILSRCFKQFKKFNQLDPQMDSSLINNRFIMRGMKDKIGFVISKHEHFTLFTLKLDKGLLRTQFNHLQGLQQYEATLDLYRQLTIKSGKVDAWFDIRSVQMKLAAKQLKLELFQFKNEKRKVIQGQIEVIELLAEQFSLKRNPKLDWAAEGKIWDTLMKNLKTTNESVKYRPSQIVSYSPNERMEQLYYKILKAVNCLVQHISNPQFFSGIMPQVLQLCELTKSANLADNIYENRFKGESSINTKICILEGHIALCKRWGWMEKASRLLHTKRQYHLQLLEFQKLRNVQTELLALNSAQMKGSASGIVAESLSNSLSEGEVNTLKQALTAIKRGVKQLN